MILGDDGRIVVMFLMRGGEPGGVIGEGTYSVRGDKLVTTPAWLVDVATFSIQENVLRVTTNQGKDVLFSRLKRMDTVANRRRDARP